VIRSTGREPQRVQEKRALAIKWRLKKAAAGQPRAVDQILPPRLLLALFKNPLRVNPLPDLDKLLNRVRGQQAPARTNRRHRR